MSLIKSRGRETRQNFFPLRLCFQFWLMGAICLVSLGCVQQRALRLALPESPVSYDQAWRSSLEASLLYYDRIVIEDKNAGFFQTNWQRHQVGVLIGTPVKRSRLIGRVASQTPFRLNLDMEQEAFSMELGRWVSDPPDRKRLFEIKDRLRARLRF